eukprot:gene5800-6498_t
MCKVVNYCCQSCQKKDWPSHKKYCEALHILSKSDENKQTEISPFFVCHISPKEQQNISRLVGNKCVIQCNLDGFSTEALWDTGSQVSVLSKQYLDDNFPNLQVAPLRQLLECDIELDVRAANGTPFRILVLFTPEEQNLLPSGLEVNESLLNIPRGNVSRVNVEVLNTTEHVITLPSRTVMGRIELIQSVIPMEVKLKPDNTNPADHIETRLETTEANSITVNCQEVNDVSQFLQQFDLSMLDLEQQQLAKAMLVEESQTFSRNDDDIGCKRFSA